MDKLTEEIAHFIGAWHLSAEEGRARHDYAVFHSRVEKVQADPIPEAYSVSIKATYDFEDFDPNVPYVASAPDLYRSHTQRLDPIGVPLDLTPWSPLHYRPDLLPAFRLQPVGKMDVQHGSSMTIEPPGQIAMMIVQHAVMSDDDYIALGDHGLAFRPRLAAGEHIAPLLEKALALDPFANAELPGSGAEIIAFANDARDRLNAFASAEPRNGANVFTDKGVFLDGPYVNGVHGQDMPDYLSYRPKAIDDADAGDDDLGDPSFVYGGRSGGDPARSDAHLAETQTKLGAGSIDRPSTVDIKAGDNTLVNSVVLSNTWLGSSVTAVLGDHVEMNAIVQTNVWSDLDNVTSALGAAFDGSTLGFNIASFKRIDPNADDHPQAAAGTHDFPSFWVVTEVTGDLLIMNWIQQVNFMMDNDVAVLSAAGTKAEIIAGSNSAMNGVSLSELGKYYDLIIVGGSVYDINIISQMNVLLDNDTIGATTGFAANGAHSLATGGNLLWNEAGIVNVGAANRFDALTEGKREAMERLAKGDKSAPGELLKDDAFAGMGAVRALYISGDIINLQFVKQTNVLGDVDKVALAMSKTHTDAQSTWSVSTGHNTLVNHAGIVDVDSFGPTHVGGQLYSDEILIQTDLISNAPYMPARPHQGADALVNEAVAFLSDDAGMPGKAGFGDGHVAGVPLGMHVAQADPMHILAA